MESGILITALVGIVTTFSSSFCTWFFAKKKYNSEVDNNLINNMKESLEFYKQLSDDNKERLDVSLERSDALEKQVRELTIQVMSLATSICTDISCQMRKGNYKDVIGKTAKKGS